MVTRNPEAWSWLVWLPHNPARRMFDACGPAPPARHRLEDALDAELHRKRPRTVVAADRVEPHHRAVADGGRGRFGPGPHWVIVDDNVGTPEQWDGVTGQKNVARHHRAAAGDHPGAGVGFGGGPNGSDERFQLREGGDFGTGTRSTRWPTCWPTAPPTAGMRGRSRGGPR